MWSEAQVLLVGVEISHQKAQQNDCGLGGVHRSVPYTGSPPETCMNKKGGAAEPTKAFHRDSTAPALLQDSFLIRTCVSICLGGESVSIDCLFSVSPLLSTLPRKS